MWVALVMSRVIIAIWFVCVQSYISTEKDEHDVWWFRDSNNNRFLSRGVDHVSYEGDYCPELKYSPYERTCATKYSSQSAWAIATAKRLKLWNFNTVGAWSDEIMENQGLMYAKILNIGGKAANYSHEFPDVFSPFFNSTAYNISREICEPRKDKVNLIGYFTDNELHWPINGTLLYYLFDLTKSDLGHSHALAFLESRYKGDFDAFKKVWNVNESVSLHHATFVERFWSADFSSFWRSREHGLQMQEEWQQDIEFYEETVAEKYFQVTHDAIKAYDPNHLILGCKFLNWPNLDKILLGAGHYVDVHSIDIYDYIPDTQRLSTFYNLSKVPWLVAEFSFRGEDSGLPNTKGAGPKVATQEDRATSFDAYVKALVKLPFAVGYHWFEWVDEPKEGRFDGENSNYGVVNITDDTYITLTSHMSQTNQIADEIHSSI
jgi:agarase